MLVVLSYDRRRVLHSQVTEHPSEEWTIQQMWEAFPCDHQCRYLLRDRDAIYGGDWVATAAQAAARLREVLRPGDVVLVKGSLAVGLEVVAENLGD